MAVVKNLMVRCGADFSALTKATNQAKASVSSLSRSTQSATTSIRKSAGTMQAYRRRESLHHLRFLELGRPSRRLALPQRSNIFHRD